MPKRIHLTIPQKRVMLWALPAGLYASLALFKSHPPFIYLPEVSSELDAALSFAMALVIAFRVNRAYERWWEARTLWGTLVNVSRNLAVKVRELHLLAGDEHQRTRDLLVAFAQGLKDHLHDKPVLGTLPGFESDPALPKHIPSYIARRLYAQFAQWQSSGKLNDQQMWVLDSEARILLDVCGGCERIKNTLMSVSWRSFTWQCIVIYLLVLPWGLVDDFGGWTIPLVTVIAYFVIAGEGIAHYVEEPFGCQEDHLDLESIVRGIDQSVSEILGVDSTAPLLPADNE